MKAKFLKRTVSAVLAGVMAVPATGFSIAPAFATETSTNSDKEAKTDYVADFGNVKNGKITFASDKAAAAKNFKAGDTVKVKLTPDDGYEVKSFTISDASSGEKLAEKETTDDVFSFAMPSMNITLAGEFSKAEGTDASDVSKGKTDDANSAKAKKAEKDAKNNVSKDASDTTEYIKNGLSDSAVSKAEKTASKEVGGEPASDIKITSEASNGLTPVKHQLTVDYLLADSSKVSKNATIDSVWKDKKKVLAQVESNAQLYSVKGNENAYVAFTDAGRMNGVGKATYADFTNGDSKNPKSYNDKVTYDKSTGIVYIPRSLFVKDGKEKQSKLVAQLLVPYDTDSSNLNGIRVTIENHDDKVKEVAKSQTVTGRSFDVTTTIPVATKGTAKDLDLSKVSIYLNDSEVPAQFAKNEYFYNKKTGELTFKGMPASIYSVKVVINGTSAAEKIVKTIAAKTFAGNSTEKSPNEIKSRDDLLALQDVGLSSDSNLPVGGQITFNTTAYYNYSVNYLLKNHKNVYNDILDYYYYCYYCDSSSSVASKDWNSILNGSGLQRMTDSHPQDQAYNEVYSYAFQLPKNAGTLRGSNGAALNFGGDADWPMTYLPLARANANQAAGVLNPDTYKNGKSVSVTARVLDNYQKSSNYKYVIIGFTMNDGTGTQPAQGVYKLRLASSEQPGYVSVQTSSKLSDQVHVANGYYSLKGAKFGVYELNPEYYPSEKEAAVITTDENGYGVNSDASAKHLRAGMTYYIKELGSHPSPGHEADTKVYPVVAVASKDAANADAPRAESLQPYLKDPLGNLLKKIDKADPTADLSGAEFKLNYYGSKNVSKNAVGGAQAEKSWVFRTNKDGVIDYKNEYKISGDSLWDYNELRLGTYTLQEIKAPVKYTTKGTIELTNGHKYNLRNPFYFRIQENGTAGVEDVDDQEDLFTKQTDTNGHSIFIRVYEVRKRGKFSVHKLDKDSGTGEAQGDADSMKWSGKVYAAQDHTWVDLNNNEDVDNGEVFQKDQEVFSFETDDKGQYTTPNFIFGYGSYYIKETSHPTGYKISNQILRFSITEDEQTVEAVDDANKKLTDEIFRGAFNFTKFDADSNTAVPQGDATLKGARFSVINSSKHYVYVNGKRYEKNAEVLTFSTDDKAQYSSADRLLPYGTYIIRETAAPTGYLNSTVRNGVMETTFSIRNDGERVSVTGIKDPVMRGKITLKKNNADVHNDSKANIASGNASFEGAEFTIYNRSANTVYVDVNHDGNYSDNERFAPGAAIETLKTDKDGNASTPDAYLPYGTYEVKETKAPEGYMIDNNFRGSVTIKTGLTVRSENQNVDLTWSAADPNHTFYDAIKRGQLKIKKNNADVHSDSDAVKAQGDSSLKGAEYTIYNKSKSYVWVDTNENGRFDAGERYEPNQAVKTIITDENGYAQTPAKYLPYGSYTVKETKAPEGYLLNEIRGAKTGFDFTINEEGQVITKYWSASNTEDTLYDAAPRGKVQIQKNNADVHSDDKASTASGNASFKGAEYTIYNRSKSYVWVDTNQNGTFDANEKFQPGASISVLTIGDNGKAETPDRYLPYGTYEIKETKAPEGYLINDKFRNSVTSKTIHVRSEGEVVDLTWSKSNAENTFYDAIKRGQLKIKKNNADVHSDSDAVKAQGDSSLKGAEYTIYNKSKSYVWVDTNENGRFDAGERYEPNQAVKIIVTDENGYAQTPANYLPYGSYTVKETKAPEGYLLDEIRGAKTSLDFTINEEGQVITKYWSASNTEDTMYNAPIRGGFKFEKKDAETKKNTPLGGANLQGTFAVTNKSKSYVWVDKNGDGAFSSDEKFKPGDQIFTFTTDAHNGTYETKSNILLPYGTYEIKETKAPTGYLKLPSKAVTFSVRKEKEMVDLTNDKAIYNYVKRGDLYFQKKTATGSKDAGKASKMAHIPFRITAYDQDGKEIESHVVYTDDNGIYDSRTSYVKHAYKTNAGDKAYAESKDGTTSFRGHVGTWFGVGSTANDNLRLNTTGAFPYGKYKIEELECAANKGYDMFVDTFVINHEEATDITMETDPEDAEGGLHGNPDFGTIYNYRMSINPEVTVKSTGEHTSPVSDDVELENKVEYSNLNVDEKYTIKAYVYDAETNTPIKDKDGKAVVITKSFTASSDNGTKNVDINLDAEALGLGGKTIVVYNEVVKDKTGKVVAYHNDPTDTDMQIRFPDVSTQGVSKNTGIGIEKAKKDVTLVDTVNYKAFEQGKKYTLKTRLYDKTADKYVALSGAESAKETTFKADNASGSVKVEATIDASDLENHSLVFYEEVYKGSNLYAKHVNKNAEEQTVRFPKIILAKQAAAVAASAQSKGILAKVADFFGLNANADDEEGSPSMAYAGKDAVYNKSVKCENLVPGQEYTLTVTLINSETKEQIKDASGKAVDQTITFTAKGETETQKVKFTFDATGMAGKTINTDASLKIKGYEIAEYIGSEKTALHIPSVKTEAAGANGTKYVKAEKNASIKDTITYANVLAGNEYTVKGTLVDAETEKAVSSAEAKFTAEKASGTAAVTFTADTSNTKGKTLVVYEDIYYGDTLVAQHKDSKDKAQCVTVVGLSGNVYDSATKSKQISLTEKAKVTDEVTYEGLLKGEKYTLTGTVSDKETGKKVAETSKEFTAENTSGKVTLEYEINAPANAGKTLSVSEALKGIVSNDSGLLHVGNVTGSKAGINGKKTAEASANTVVSDCISYDNLLKGSSYRAEAILYDNETGKPLTRKCGKAVSGSTEFTASDSKGTVNVSIKADTSDLAGKKILVFEKIYMDNIVVAYHDGKASDDNTITITENKPDTCDQVPDTGDQTKDTGDQTKNPDTCDQVKDTGDQAKDTGDQTKKSDSADQNKTSERVPADTSDQTKKPDTGDQSNAANAGTNANVNTAGSNTNASDSKTGLDAILSLIKGLTGIANTADENSENNAEESKDTADQTENSDESTDENDSDKADNNSGKKSTPGRSTSGNESSYTGDEGTNGVSQRNGNGYSESPSSMRESGRNAKSKDTGDYNHIAVYVAVAAAAAAAIAIVIVLRRKRD